MNGKELAKTIVSRNNRLIILQLAGLGDTLSLITRTNSMLEQHPTHLPVFYLGGFGKSAQMSKEQLEREGYEAHVIKNLNHHSQLPSIIEFLKKEIASDGDIVLDCSFCHEIFNNQDPVFMKYDIQDFYDYRTSVSAVFKNIDFSKAIVIHPLTKSGNIEGFESDIQKGRFWSKENWLKLIGRLNADGFLPTFIGIADEDYGLRDELRVMGIEYQDLMGLDIPTTMEVLKMSAGCIATNSWDWEVASRHQVPTVCFYTKNHFFIKLHVPQRPSKFYDTCYVETAVDADPDIVYDTWKYIFDNRKKPDIEYSVCSICFNDKGYIEKTVDNIEPYLNEKNNWVIVDGDSQDGTYEYLKNLDGSIIDNMILERKKWNNNFAEQKNYALEQSEKNWRVWIDADEQMEHLFWNQLPWYIWQAEKQGVDCINVPRINTIKDISNEEIKDWCNRQGWNLSFFNWINYPDYQQRIFKVGCVFTGKSHERIIGGNGMDTSLVGVHILHSKTLDRQQKGLEREQVLYIEEAEEVYNRIIEDG